jgi:subtilase family serine protease
MRVPRCSHLTLAALLGVSLCGFSMDAQAQRAWPRGGQVIVPESSVENPATIGGFAHTHLRVFVPAQGAGPVAPPSRSVVRQNATAKELPPLAGYSYLETPASLACVYNLVSTIVPGCNPYSTVTDPSGGSKAIALVDAYDDPTAASDLAAFSNQFGLPAANFQVVYASGTKPARNSSWVLEEALDVEWAHAMAPNAKIYLVEAASSSMANLMAAVTVASNLVSAAGGGEVSMSWGSSEFSGEKSYDSYFTKPGVVYFASAGDSPGVEYPSSSPNVVGVGGTSISRNPITGAFQAELAWQQTGGGPSAYETIPSYQSSIAGTVGSARGVPDVSAVADPTTGVWVYEAGSWYIVGGTSVASPVWAGIVNAAGTFNASSAAELAMIYGNSSGYNPIANGDCGPNEGYLAMSPWSFCTGHGVPSGSGNK